ncbi:MAG TPA: superoxide dismutase [Candidatus Avirikenella pullistercoris]|nr:superoxide dismutase [Candidatus Avirikenella pullistercoris]
MNLLKYSRIALILSLGFLSVSLNKTYGQTVTERFKIIQLPYATDALEPVISKETIDYHYGKHLQGYVNNLNKLIAGTKFENAPLEIIVTESDGSLFNNAGQTLNHNLYFTQFSPEGGGKPVGKLADAINKKWGSFENFQKAFTDAGNGLFGSGWVWLAKDKKGDLFITQEINGSNPIVKGLTPLLGFDVWEHAYYIDYRNNRAGHINALWDIIDWETVNQRYQ